MFNVLQPQQQTSNYHVDPIDQLLNGRMNNMSISPVPQNAGMSRESQEINDIVQRPEVHSLLNSKFKFKHLNYIIILGMN